MTPVLCATEADSLLFSMCVDQKELDKLILDRVKVDVSSMKIPGWRPGKAPVSILKNALRKRIGTDAYEQLEYETCLEKSESHIRKMDAPPFIPGSYRIMPESVVRGSEFQFQFMLDRDAMILTEPEFSKLPNEVRIPRLILSDSFLTEHMWKQYRSKAPLETMDEDRAVKTDIITVTYGYVNGEKKYQDTLRLDLLTKTNPMAPWIDVVKTQCVGARSGDTITLENHTVPEQWPNEEIRGMILTLEIHVIKVERPQLESELSDDVASDLGFQSLSEWTGMVRDDVEHTLTQMNQDATRNHIINTLTGITVFHITRPALHVLLLEQARNIMPQYAPRPETKEQKAQYDERLTYLYASMLKDLDDDIEKRSKGDTLPENAVLHMLEREIAGRLLRRYVSEKWGKEPEDENILKHEIASMLNIGIDDAHYGERTTEFLSNPSNLKMVSQVFRFRSGIEAIMKKFDTTFIMFDSPLESQG